MHPPYSPDLAPSTRLPFVSIFTELSTELLV